MLDHSRLILRVLLQTVLFPIWAFELELETLFRDGEKRAFLNRLRQFPAKLAVRITFLVLGGYHRVQLERAALNCKKSQDRVLDQILNNACDTAFGRDFNFVGIRSYADYVSQVPVLTYADHEPYIERQMQGEADAIVPETPLYYATTSGTTGKPKYIPVTSSAARSHRKVSLIWAYYLSRRNIGFLNDSLITITGQAIEGAVSDGTPYGSTSGQLRSSLPRFMRQIYVIPEEVFLIENYEARYYCLALFGLKSYISHVASANPSTLLILFETIDRHHSTLIKDIEFGRISTDISLDENVRQKLEARLSPDPHRADELRRSLIVSGRMDVAYYWPNLASLACWKGGNSKVFIERIRQFIPDVVPVFDLGYLASELRATVPVERLHHGGVPTLNDNFFEFIPLADWEDAGQSTLRLHELKLGEQYYVIVTTNSGLYRYHINDIVRVVGYFGDTPELVFEQKGDGVTNLTGEKLYEQQIQLAISSACAEAGIHLRFFMAILNIGKSRYEFLVEPASSQGIGNLPAQHLLRAIDRHVGEVNIEYRAKRDSLRLKSPCLHLLEAGGFDRYRAKMIEKGVREAQFKMVLLSSNICLLEEFDVVENYQWSET